MAERRPIPKLGPRVAAADLRTARPIEHQRYDDPNRPSSAERGYGAEWRKARELVLRRDNWLCVPCRRAGRATPAAEVDHVVPKEEGGTDAHENLQSICRDCHTAKTASEKASRRLNGYS